QLNREAAKHNLQFGPEVATASRANLGGMIGNNSAGARSIVYGKTIDHVHSLRAILSDGSRTEFAPIKVEEWNRKAACKSLEGNIYRSVRQIVQQNAAEIRRRFPTILRRVSGYNLDQLDLTPASDIQSADQALVRNFAVRTQEFGLEKLIIGS